MKLYNRKFFIAPLFSLLFYVLPCDLKAQESLIKLQLIQLNIKSNRSFSLVCKVENIGQDTTLILSFPFLFEGIKPSARNIRFWPDMSSLVNLVYHESARTKLSFAGDGSYRLSFREFPNLLILPPKKIIRIQLSATDSLLVGVGSDSLYFWMYLRYGIKRELDKLVKAYPNLWHQYLAALIRRDFLQIDLIPTELFSTEHRENTKSTIYEILQNGLNYVASSPKRLFIQ